MAKGKLNIYRDTFLEKEELDRLVSFINDNPALFLFVSSTQQFGIIQQSVVDPAFLVEVGTNANTVKITADSYALDSLGHMIYQRTFDNLPVPTDSNYYWMKISHRYDNYEIGFVDIAVDGTLSGAGTAFTDVLRGNSSGFPVKVKFFTQADDGTLTPAANSGVYEVVNVVNANTATISGNLSAESNLRYVVLGAFSIKTSVAAITSTGMYSYDSCQIDFVLEAVTDTAPIAGFTAGEDFYIARVYCDGVTVTITDKRDNYYFRLNFGDLALDNKADLDASNLSAGNVTSWLAKLSVYTQAQITTLLTGYLLKSQNLNDLANKTTARTNLGVYGTSAIDAIIGSRTYEQNVLTSNEALGVSLAKIDALLRLPYYFNTSIALGTLGNTAGDYNQCDGYAQIINGRMFFNGTFQSHIVNQPGWRVLWDDPFFVPYNTHYFSAIASDGVTYLMKVENVADSGRISVFTTVTGLDVYYSINYVLDIDHWALPV